MCERCKELEEELKRSEQKVMILTTGHQEIMDLGDPGSVLVARTAIHATKEPFELRDD